MSTDAPRQSDNTLKIVLIVVGAIVLLIALAILACAGLGYFAMRTASNAASNAFASVGEMINAQTALQTFMMDVQAGRGAAAYVSTTANFRTKQTQDEFQALLDQHPELKRANSANFQPLQPMGQQTTMKFRSLVSDNRGQMSTVTVDLVKEGQQWKVDAFDVK
jgi:flagellar basal body-associated protein FliL